MIVDAYESGDLQLIESAIKNIHTGLGQLDHVMGVRTRDFEKLKAGGILE